MKRTKRILAATAAATLLFSSMTAFATETTDPDDGRTGGTIGGSGDLEGWVDKDVFRIVLPTVANVNFTTDPQGLLKVADSFKYTVGEGAVYFENASTTAGGDPTYSGTSDKITFINKSSYDVDVKLNVKLNTGDIKLVSSASDLTDAEEPSLYMGLIIGSDAAVALTADYDAAVKTVTGVPEADGTNVTKGYQIKATPKTGGTGWDYSYELTSGFADTDAQSISYQLTGACDSTADWSKITNKTVSAQVIWNCVKKGENVVQDAAPSIPTTATYDATNDSGTVVVDLGAGTTATTITSVKYGGKADNINSTLTYTEATPGTITYTLTPWKTQVGSKKYLEITLADGTSQVVEVTIQ